MPRLSYSGAGGLDCAGGVLVFSPLEEVGSDGRPSSSRREGQQREPWFPQTSVSGLLLPTLGEGPPRKHPTDFPKGMSL